MVEERSENRKEVRPETERTKLGPIVIFSVSLLVSWSAWAVGIYPYARPRLGDYSTAVGVAARLIFWGVPAGLYLHRYWGSRALEPLGLTFPLGATQRLRTLLITLVVALCLLVGTAAQAGVHFLELGRRLVIAQSVDFTAPILEELVFRGIVVAELLNWTHDSSRTPLELRLKFWGGQLGGALLFVAIHWPYWVSHFGLEHALSLSLPVLVTGLILGFVFATTRSIWGCIALHWLNNALSQLT